MPISTTLQTFSSFVCASLYGEGTGCRYFGTEQGVLAVRVSRRDIGNCLTVGGCRRTRTLTSSSAAWPKPIARPGAKLRGATMPLWLTGLVVQPRLAVPFVDRPVSR